MSEELLLKISEYVLQTELLNAMYIELEAAGKTDDEIFDLTKDLANSKMILVKEIYDIDKIMGEAIIINYDKIKGMFLREKEK